MKLATKNLVFQGLNEGDIVNFSEVETVEQLKETIVYRYVFLCRGCVSASFCKFYDHNLPCPILEKVVHNYIDMNIKCVDTQNQFLLGEFIKSVILLIEMFYKFENWRGTYIDEDFNLFFESVHPRLNSIYAHDLLVEMSKFVRAYRVVKTDLIKKFTILVEGHSEYEALPPIFDVLGRGLGINLDKNSVEFINLEGKDRIQRDKIKTHLLKFMEKETSYFLILDNDSNVKQNIEDLKGAGLIKDNHYLIWENKFEDNFGEEVILKALREELSEIFDNIDIDELKRYNSTKNDIGKSIEHLLIDKGIKFRFKDYKVRIAKRLADWICKEIDESMHISPNHYDGSRNPTSKSFPEFVEKLRKIVEEMKRISSQFHVMKS